VLRLLDHAAEAPRPEDVTDEDGGLDMDPDMDFGAGHAAEGDTGTIEDGGELDLDDDDTDVDDGDKPEGGDAVSLVDDLDPSDTFAFEEEEVNQIPEPEEDGVESEEVPGHWGDQHQDDGGLDPQDFGDDLGDLPHA